MSSLSVSDGKAIISAGCWFGETRPEVVTRDLAKDHFVLKLPVLDGEINVVVTKDDVCVLLSALEQFVMDITEGQEHLSNQKEGNIVPVLDSIASGGNG